MRFPGDTVSTLDACLASLPSGSVVDLAPGRYQGPLSITRPITIRGAGELTRIFGVKGRAISISVRGSSPVVLQSIRLEQGYDADGGGLLVTDGDVHLRNVHIQDCGVRGRGGAVAVTGGAVAANRLYTLGTRAYRGGALWVGGQGQLTLRNSQLSRCEAMFGGALAVEDLAVVDLDQITIDGARARLGAGGQALHVRGSPSGRPTLRLNRVRFADPSVGTPVVIDQASPIHLRLEACDVPKTVRRVEGLIDGGENRWR